MAKILIADDKEENRFVLSNFFKLFGPNSHIDIIEASNSKEAVEKAKAEKPDLILLDIKMETNDAGLLALNEIRDILDLKDVKIWAITAQAQDALQTNIFDDYIMKPFDIIQLLQKVSESLNIKIPESTQKKIDCMRD